MKAYLLAAGYATRLYPLTRDQPKPLLEIAGEPMLSHIVRKVSALDGLSEIVVIGNHRFADAFHAWAAEQRCPVPLRVLDDGSTDESDRLGAVGDLAFALREVPLRGEDWLVVAGDNWLGFDLAAARREFLERKRPLLLVRRVPVADGPSPYNEVRLDEAGRVLRFREKPADPQTDVAAICVYFFTPEVQALLEHYLAGDGNPDAPGHFIEWLVQRAPVEAVPFEGDWLDIGSLETLEEARRRFGGA